MCERGKFSFNLYFTNILSWTVKGGSKVLAPKPSYNVTLIGLDEEMGETQGSGCLYYGPRAAAEKEYIVRFPTTALRSKRSILINICIILYRVACPGVVRA